jgi:AraC-like DNA-binding protein/photosystem II stability/assembly factor-like uncharacterized protein
MAVLATTCVHSRLGEARGASEISRAARSPHVERMMALIEERCEQRLSLRTMAASLGRQAAYLGRLFRQETGLSTRDYLAQCRLDRAAGLIRQGDKVEAVALEVGYRSKKNFYRQFRHRFSMTPAEYRRCTPDTPRSPTKGHALDGLTFRPIGPAVAGGRILAIAVAEGRPSTFYVAGPGGLWKTENNGTTWLPVFEGERSAAVVTLAVAPSDPNVVWIGTGEESENPSTSGDGVYRSVDGGRTWTNAGFRQAHHVRRLLIHPRDPATVYVAAWGPRLMPRRKPGLYKTTDGGRTWTGVLFVDDERGVTDFAILPSEPQRVIAGVTRLASLERADSETIASGLYVSDDGGVTWARRTNGLPASEIHGASLDICRRHANVVYTALSGADGGIFRSDDGGDTWHRMSGPLDPIRLSSSARDSLSYGGIRVDPDDPMRIYLLGERLHISDDGGRTFHTDPAHGARSGHHALWIDPADPHHIVDGSDEGISVSYDRAHTWQSLRNLPLASVCRVAVDMQTPYRVYAGLRDSPSWSGPSATRQAVGIANREWTRIPGAGLLAVPAPNDATTIYAQACDRCLVRYDARTREHKMIRPAPSDDRLAGSQAGPSMPLPLVISGYDPSTLYVGLERVFKSPDRGVSWSPISPELAGRAAIRRPTPPRGDSVMRADPPRSVAITALAQSAKRPGLLYAGTDDGYVFVRRDSGSTWQDVSARIAGVPAHSAVSRLATSWQDAETAYVAFDGHQDDDVAPHLYMTTDAGRSWAPIVSNLTAGPVHAISEDPHHRNVLYAGTEAGLFVSFNRGARWTLLRNNLPTVPVTDIVVHPRDNDLVVATRGRGIWILDDATPLQEWTDRAPVGGARLFGVRPGTQWVRDAEPLWLGDGTYVAPNPVEGVLLTYHLTKAAPAGVKLVIRNARAAVVRELDGPGEPGLHRVAWDLRLPPPQHLFPPGAETSCSPHALLGAFALPDHYAITLLVAGRPRDTQMLRVEADPLVSLSDAARELQQRGLIELTAMQDAVAAAAATLHSAGAQLQAVRDRLARMVMLPSTVVEAAGSLARRIRALSRIVEGNGEETATDRATIVAHRVSFSTCVNRLKGEIAGSASPPTPLQAQMLVRCENALNRLVVHINAILTHQLPALNRQLEHHGASPVRVAARSLPPLLITA